ncbi:MAG: LysR family transcriptional regulator [Pseudomonadota bacterium]
MDRMRALEVCIAVAEQGSLAAAARALEISAPSVTRILGELESDLGVLLFHRSTRALTLTADGEQFTQDARELVSGYQTARDAIRNSNREPRGTLRLTAPAMFGQLYVQPVVREYLERFPGVRVDAVLLDHLVNLVAERFDVAVRIGELPDSSLMATRVGEVRSVVCASEGYLQVHGEPQTPAALANHSIVHCGAISDPAWRFSGDVEAKLKPRYTVSSVPAAIAAATSGWGITRVLSYQIDEDVRNGRLREILLPYAVDPIPIHLVHAEGRLASNKVRRFVEMARDALRAIPHLNYNADGV